MSSFTLSATPTNMIVTETISSDRILMVVSKKGCNLWVTNNIELVNYEHNVCICLCEETQ